MENIGMSGSRLEQVCSYFVMRWARCRGVKYHECTAVLPTTLGTSVCYFLYSETAYKVRVASSLFTSVIYFRGS